MYNNIKNGIYTPASRKLEAIRRMADRFLRWFLINTAGSWSPPHCDAAGSFTEVYVESGMKLWIIYHLVEGHHEDATRVECLILRAGDRL